MSKMATDSKTQRVLRFLGGVRHKGVREALQPFGFDDAQVEKGWALLRDALEARNAYDPHAARDLSIAKACDDWRSRWFAVAQSALRCAYPEVEAWLFKGLEASRGDLATVAVPLFAKRLRSMEAEQAPVAGAKGARELLVQRGLTEAELAKVDVWVNDLAKVASAPSTDSVTQQQEVAAQTALWSWYLEWSGIARAAIHNKAMLRELGFGKARKAAGSLTPQDTEETASPAPPVQQNTGNSATPAPPVQKTETPVTPVASAPPKPESTMNAGATPPTEAPINAQNGVSPKAA